MSNWYDGIEERVVAAYRAKGLRAITGLWWAKGGEACCALGALHHDIVKRHLEPDRQHALPDIVARVAREIGVPALEIISFYSGFDGGSWMQEDQCETDAERAGWRTWQAIVAAGIPGTHPEVV